MKGIEMRLQNIQSFGKGKQTRVVLDSSHLDANYIETTSGVFYDTSGHEHRCLKCLEPSNWENWPTANRADSKCKCGETHTLNIKSFNENAGILIARY
jgi:hypothetical protein